MSYAGVEAAFGTYSLIAENATHLQECGTELALLRSLE